MCAEIAVFVLNLSDTIFLRTAPHSLVQVHSNNNTGRCRESDPSIRNRRF